MTMREQARPVERLPDQRPERGGVVAEVTAGLRQVPKRLPSKYFYDARGSELFERICEQPEYYLTRAELAIMREHLGGIAQAIGPGAMLVEYGSGSGLKTRLLLQRLDSPVAYVPIEISRSALLASVAALGAAFPCVQKLPLCADFTRAVTLPKPARRAHRTVIYFPGSTIGNFDTHEAIRLLRQMRIEMGANGMLLIGVDLKKDAATLEAAYNDAAGVTAAFTLNMLARFNREIGSDFEPGAFRHRARWNPLAGRIETHLVSTRAQTVHVAGEAFAFAAGEAMLVEYSCKYSTADFARMAARAGLRVLDAWGDDAGRFGVQLLGDAAYE